jgi:uncharacterized membrane protein YphA (DoxX/SURF4 family)
VNVGLWVAQGLLAVVFVFSGYTKGTWSRERLVARGQTGAKIVPLWLLRPVAALELLGAAGLILPWLTGVAAWLTPLAAIGLGVVMVGAAGIHLRLREPLTALGNTVILAACVFVAVGRS